MDVVFALQPIAKSIFLAGPTPRDDETPTWRPEALAILEELGFEGTVYVPESEDWAKHDSYDLQVDWEWAGIDASRIVVFWVPRDLSRNSEGEMKMPAFTTNVEFGLVARSGKGMLGFPAGAKKTSYLNRLAEKVGMPVYGSMRELLAAAVERARSSP
jgi:hypothetical protein